MKTKGQISSENYQGWIKQAAKEILQALSYDTTKDVNEQFLERHQEGLNKPRKTKKNNGSSNKK